MSGGGDNKEQKPIYTKNEPWAAQQPYLQDVMRQGQSLYNQGFSAMPVGQVAPNLNLTGGWTGMMNYANTGGQGVTQNAQNTWNTLRNSIDVANNPLVQSQIANSNALVARDFNQKIMPGITNEAVGAGQFGSSRQGVAEGMASQAAADAMSRGATDIMANAYQIGSQNAQNALGQSQNMWQMGAMPAMVQGQVGQQQQGYQQAMQDDAMRRWWYSQQRPWDLLSQYQGAVQGNYGSTTSKA